MRCHEPDAARFGRITLGMPYVEFDVPLGTADGIADFYPEMFGDAGARSQNGDGTVARVADRARTSICISARPTRRSRTSTAITCRSTSPISPGPIDG